MLCSDALRGVLPSKFYSICNDCRNRKKLTCKHSINHKGAAEQFDCRVSILGCGLSDSSDFRLQTVRLKRFWVADCQTQAISCCGLADVSDCGSQAVRLKRIWVPDCHSQAILDVDRQAQAIVCCGLAALSDCGLQVVRLERFWVADCQTHA